METEEIRSVLGRLGALVGEHYVFPEVGTEIAGRLAAAVADGAYDELRTPADLAERVTADLQVGNRDKHLRLKFHRDGLPDETDPVAEKAYWQRRAALDAGGFARIERLDGNIGLLELRPLLYPPELAGAAVAAAMSLLASTDALLLDLRRCLGGSPDQVALVCSYLFGSDEPVHLQDLVSPSEGRTRQFWTSPYLAGPRYDSSKPIWVLTSSATFSGGEELSYNLQQFKRGVVVGERTGGGAHPRRGFKLHEQLEASVPVARSVNQVSGTNWEGTGVAPDVEVSAEQAFDEAYRRAAEYVLGMPADPVRNAVTDEARAVLGVVVTAG
ncbi:S41 family peptidase [Kribbella solani]|uniref:S41 family peptidase n=1 Tax=Kribbella solani TaxID=236067 RepID=UPI0029A31941|nr:S41 family peptidase [Kribbella solani]MDX2970946.1 S41 family peptidase [Kribbella solani]MDX3000255.1 S41 family peptidase [Kribbella solani]